MICQLGECVVQHIRGFDYMNDCSFIYLYMYHIFSLFHSDKANLGCDTNCISYLISSEIRSKGLNKIGLSFGEHMTKRWFRIDKMSILNECIPLWSITQWLLNWNMMMKNSYLG